MNYISVLETLGQPWSKPYDGIKWLTCKANSCNLSIIFFGYQCHAKFCLFNHSHKKWKDCLEGSLYRVLLAAKFEFLKILVPTLRIHHVNIECARQSELSKKLYSLYVTSFLEHWYILILLFWHCYVVNRWCLV